MNPSHEPSVSCSARSVSRSPCTHSGFWGTGNPLSSSTGPCSPTVSAGLEEQDDVVSLAASMEEGEFKGGTEDPSCLEGSPSENMAPSSPLADKLAALVSRAAAWVQIPWTEETQIRRSVFETSVSTTQHYKPFPVLLDFVKELQSSWGSPAETPATSSTQAAPAKHSPAS
ncbi:UNVERIFIED_CONTAM: hypothetical protein FKN15_004538 [Acipenser sinensis]